MGSKCLKVLLGFLLLGVLLSQKEVMGASWIGTRLAELGWRILYYESDDRELEGNRGIAPGGYLIRPKEEVKVVTVPRMLPEEELEGLRKEITLAMAAWEVGRKERWELAEYLRQVESQLEAYRGQFEVLGGVTYRVRGGDSLWEIARTHYGDPYKWPFIYRANKERIPNPNVIFPGQRLVIPRIRVIIR